MNLPKHLHVVGICGVATSAIAIAFHKRGVRVTGSDKGFFPPVSIELEKHDIFFYSGWHPEKMITENKPDLIMTGGAGTSSANPEVLFAKEAGIPILTFPEILQKYFIKKNSIVCAGTWGKTTTSSIISFVLIRAGLDPSYFSGGLSLSHDTGAISDMDWSVVEGDEYQVSISDKRPKFVYYSPTHLLLTSVSWDHADLYPTEEKYFTAFENLLTNIPANGLVIANNDDKGVMKIIHKNKGRTITYGSDKADYIFDQIAPSRQGLDFAIRFKEQIYRIHSPMLGRYNAENITGAFALLKEIGILPEIIIESIADFRGIRRRFEKRYEDKITILDCHAPTPEKAASALASIKEVYNSGKILAIFEPNIGGRERETNKKYDRAFKDADMVFIPRLTKLKIAADEAEKPMEGDELTKVISKTHEAVIHNEDDSKLVASVTSSAKQGDVIVFLGSHGFRGMIEESIKSLQGIWK
ncbi:MAG: Mur ligase family protein [Candidatus Paceibacterota bacterium]